jgi:hypothetical protein
MSTIRRARHATGSAVAGCLLLAGSAALASTEAPSGDRRTAARPGVATTVVVTPLGEAHPVRGVDGRWHVPYELQVINPAGTATIDRVAVLDAATGDELAALEGDAVGEHLVPLTATTSGDATLQAGDVAMLVMNVALDAPRPPRSLEHVVTLRRDPAMPTLPDTVTVAPMAVAGVRPIVIGPPLRGDGWLAANGCCAEATSHRSAALVLDGRYTVAQRFAIDFARLDAEGRLFVGPADDVTGYVGYGAEVLAVGAGVVVDVRDGIPDNVPGTIPPIDPDLQGLAGNAVSIDLGRGRFAHYGHLQPGSIPVAVGDRVRPGQVLGLLGNSGNSTFPHLHFQVTDDPSLLAGEGRPYELRSFTSAGFVVAGDIVAGAPAVIEAVLTGPVARRLPLNLQVVAFETRGR